MTLDKNIELVKIQNEIESYIGLGQDSVLFNFSENNNVVMLHVITVNPRHNQSFLFHKEEGTTKIDALKKMLEYVKNYKDKESSYTIQWSSIKEDQLQTSYFSAKNVLGALDKLFYDKDPNSITIYSINLNPIT
ncbi:MAG: hypothetical protein HKN39_05485 [Flavobacteriales bacterium]|nr:hypothetical protein [Flavobacteriales bacterium]